MLRIRVYEVLSNNYYKSSVDYYIFMTLCSNGMYLSA